MISDFYTYKKATPQDAPFPTELNTELSVSDFVPLSCSRTTFLLFRLPQCEFPSGHNQCLSLLVSAPGCASESSGRFKQKSLQAQHQTRYIRVLGMWGPGICILNQNPWWFFYTTQHNSVASDFEMGHEQPQQPAMACSSVEKQNGNWVSSYLWKLSWVN